MKFFLVFGLFLLNSSLALHAQAPIYYFHNRNSKPVAADAFKVGDQKWAKQALVPTMLSDRYSLIEVRNKLDWKGGLDEFRRTPIYSGGLFNWAAVQMLIDKPIPGWHIPSKEEWETYAEVLRKTDDSGIYSFEKKGVGLWDFSKGFQSNFYTVNRKTYGFYWSSDTMPDGSPWFGYLENEDNFEVLTLKNNVEDLHLIGKSNFSLREIGMPIRLIRNQDSINSRCFTLFNGAAATQIIRDFELPLFYKWPNASDAKSFFHGANLLLPPFGGYYHKPSFCFIDAGAGGNQLLPGLKIWVKDPSPEKQHIFYAAAGMMVDYINPPEVQTGAALVLIPDFSREQFVRANNRSLDEVKSLFNQYVAEDEREKLYRYILQALAYVYCYESIDNDDLSLKINYNFDEGMNKSSVFLSDKTPLTNAFLTKVIQRFSLTMDNGFDNNLVINEEVQLNISCWDHIDVTDTISIMRKKKEKFIRKKGVSMQTIDHHYRLSYRDTNLPRDLTLFVQYEKYDFSKERLKRRYFPQKAKQVTKNYVILWNNVNPHE
jgi:hypothetical protein